MNSTLANPTPTPTPTSTTTPTSTSTSTSTITSDTTLPLDSIINSIAAQKGISKAEVTCDDVKEVLLKVTSKSTASASENGNENEILVRDYNISFKEDKENDLILFYYNEQHENLINSTSGPVVTNEVENSCKSCVYTISGLSYLCSQFNRIVYNEQVINLLDSKLENAIIQKCYEGTTLLVFNHNDKWFISTRKCIDASSSTWVKNQSYKDLFEETFKDEDNSGNIYNNLNKNYCYVFILVHHKNKNIVNYNQPFRLQNRYYKKLYLSNVTIKGTYNEILRSEYELPNVSWTEEVKFNSVEELLDALRQISEADENCKSITTEGFVVKIYKDSNKQGKFLTGKLQTGIYRYVMSYKPNVQNIYQIYLELYKQDKLTELLPYFYRGKNTIILKIHNSMKIITKEMLELYHMTRNKRNEALYDLLPKVYKKMLYDLHGIYIKCKKIAMEQKDKHEELPNSNEEGYNSSQCSFKTESLDDSMNFGTSNNKSINIHDVYNHLKTLPLKQLIKIFQEREKLVEAGSVKCLNTKDMDISIYTKLLLD
jgi:hypothetical protein